MINHSCNSSIRSWSFLAGLLLAGNRGGFLFSGAIAFGELENFPLLWLDAFSMSE
jgi:hypothetical protein